MSTEDKAITLTERATRRFQRSFSTPAGSCWLWTKHVRRDGYGVFKFHGRNYAAHRVAWMLANGPIPAGLCVCHRCDVRLCVNAAHLFLGTIADNQRDMAFKGRSTNRKLTVAQVREMLHELRRGVPQRILATRYGINQWSVSHIKARKTYREVEI